MFHKVPRQRTSAYFGGPVVHVKLTRCRSTEASRERTNKATQSDEQWALLGSSLVSKIDNIVIMDYLNAFDV